MKRFGAGLAAAAMLAGGLTVVATTSAGAAVHDGGAITIPASGTGPGVSSPYPSSITVAGEPGAVTDVNVTLDSFSHTWMGDVHAVLVGPSGQKVVLLRGLGSSQDAVSDTMTFDDEAAVDYTGGDPGGTWKPATDQPTTMPGPAPAGPYSTALSVFDGTNPNGAWDLYIYDDAGGDSGSVGSWSLDIATSATSEDFESGFTGWTATGLWNPEQDTDTCGAMVAPFPDPTGAAYYGRRRRGPCDYDTTVPDRLTPPTRAPSTSDFYFSAGGASAVLQYQSYIDTESDFGFDNAIVEASTDGVTWTQVDDADTAPRGVWSARLADLSAFAGAPVRIRFSFDTVDVMTTTTTSAGWSTTWS